MPSHKHRSYFSAKNPTFFRRGQRYHRSNIEKPILPRHPKQRATKLPLPDPTAGQQMAAVQTTAQQIDARVAVRLQPFIKFTFNRRALFTLIATVLLCQVVSGETVHDQLIKAKADLADKEEDLRAMLDESTETEIKLEEMTKKLDDASQYRDNLLILAVASGIGGVIFAVSSYFYDKHRREQEVGALKQELAHETTLRTNADLAQFQAEHKLANEAALRQVAVQARFQAEATIQTLQQQLQQALNEPSVLQRQQVRQQLHQELTRITLEEEKKDGPPTFEKRFENLESECKGLAGAKTLRADLVVFGKKYYCPVKFGLMNTPITFCGDQFDKKAVLEWVESDANANKIEIDLGHHKAKIEELPGHVFHHNWKIKADMREKLTEFEGALEKLKTAATNKSKTNSAALASDVGGKTSSPVHRKKKTAAATASAASATSKPTAAPAPTFS